MSFNGASIATLIAELAQMSIQVYHSRDYVKDNLRLNAVFRIAISSVISSIITYFSVFLHIHVNYIVGFIIDAVVFFAVFGLMILLLKDPVAKGYVLDILKRIRKKHI